MNEVKRIVLLLSLLPLVSWGQSAEKKEALAKLQNQAAACKMYLSEKSNPRERDILAEITPCGMPSGHPLKAIPADFLRSMQQLDQHLNPSQYETVLNETQRTALYNNYVSHLSMSEHVHGVRSYENRKLGLLETLNKVGGPKGDPFLEAMKLKAVNDYVKQVPLSKVTTFWDQDQIQKKSAAFNSAVDELNHFCKAATKKDNALFGALVSSVASGATGIGTAVATYSAKGQVQDANLVKAKALVGKLYNTDYGKLLFSSSFSGHVGVFSPTDCVNGKLGGARNMELEKIPSDRTARDRLLKSAVTDLDVIVSKQALDLAKDREALKKGTSIEDQADILKKYLKSNPLAFKALLANKSNPRDFQLSCHLIGEILDSDKKHQYVDYAATGAAVAAAGLLGASVVGAPIGAALLATIGTASSVMTITNAGFQYADASRDGNLYVSGAVSNSKDKEVALHAKQKTDEIRKKSVETAVLEVAPIAAAGAFKVVKNARTVEHLHVGRVEQVVHAEQSLTHLPRTPATEYFHSFSGKQAEVFLDFKKSVKFEKLSPAQQQKLLDKMYKVHMANNTPGEVASIGKKRDLVELEAYLRDELKLDPKVAREQIRALADKDVKILGAEARLEKYVAQPVDQKKVLEGGNEFLQEKVAALFEVKNNPGHLPSSRRAAESEIAEYVQYAKQKVAKGLMTEDEYQSLLSIQKSGATPPHVSAAPAKHAAPAVDKEAFSRDLNTQYSKEALAAKYEFAPKSLGEGLERTASEIKHLEKLKLDLLAKGESAGVKAVASGENVNYHLKEAVVNVDHQIAKLAKAQAEMKHDLTVMDKAIDRAVVKNEYSADKVAYVVKETPQAKAFYKEEISKLVKDLKRIKQMEESKQVTTAELPNLKGVQLGEEIKQLEARLKELD